VKLSGTRNQCSGCDEYFSSNESFDMHRIGEHGKDRRCATPTEMLAKKMVKNKRGFWLRRERKKETYENHTV
jgi:hypothetical protein